MKCISIARDFSPFPGGRYRQYGPFSGEQFREEILLPALGEADDSVVVVDLSDVFTFSPSFLDEAFAEVVRKRLMSLEEFERRVRFVADAANEPYVLLARKYLKEAEQPLRVAS